MKIKAEDFAEWLVKQVPVFDEEIMAEIRPQLSWEGVTFCGHADMEYKMWIATTKSVRKLSEGLAYKSGGNYDFDPNIWKPVSSGVVIGNIPVDAFYRCSKNWKK